MAEHELQSVAFPVLTPAQLATLDRCASPARKSYPAGTTLFQVGDRELRFFVVLSGEVEILDPSTEPPSTVVIHGPGQFTGDVSHLTGRPAVVTAVARSDCEVYEVAPEAVRKVLDRCAELGDTILQAFIARRQLLRERGSFAGLRVIGSSHSKDTFRIREFLARNRVLFAWLDLESDPDVDALLRRFGIGPSETPVVAWRELLLRNPSNRQLAELLGIRRPLESAIHDLVIVGAGPAGLAAAVYGASEGLRTVVLERTAPGGQAASSMRIENYLGFPTGITGAELAERAVLQAQKFGAGLNVSALVSRLGFDGVYPVIQLDEGEQVTTKCLLIATGAEYRRLGVADCERFEGCGVYYAATVTEAVTCRGADVVVVGGGNSAGQATVFLASQSRKVYLVVRGYDLYENMSAYLARRIEETPNVEVLLNSEIAQMQGDASLQKVTVHNRKTGEQRVIETPALFSFIGAVPRTEWLPPEIEVDERGFVRTGADVTGAAENDMQRGRCLLQSSRRGVLAAGDVRSGSTKRVTSAVGEGAMAVQFVHAYLRGL
jgi:thioredoxin reductase (NADPH)